MGLYRTIQVGLWVHGPLPLGSRVLEETDRFGEVSGQFPKFALRCLDTAFVNFTWAINSIFDNTPFVGLENSWGGPKIRSRDPSHHPLIKMNL